MSQALTKLEAEGLDIVVLGSFNSAIFHPDWFLHQHLVGDDEAQSAEVKVVSSQVSDITIGEIHILCVADRLSIGTKNVAYAEKVYDLICGVLTLLPHTPVRACGINPTAHYRITDEKYYHQIGHTLVPKDRVWNKLLSRPGMLSLVVTSPRPKSEYPGRTNITVAPSFQVHPGLYVLVNDHFDVPENNRQTGGADVIKKFLQSEWKESVVQARNVAEMIFSTIEPNEH